MARIGIIDCGTNTFNLLVADISVAGWTSVFNQKLPVKLQEGGFLDGGIREVPFKRAVDAFTRLTELAKEKEVSTIHSFATSAVREASNGTKLVEEIYKETKVTIKIIDGQQEADLIKKGVLQTVSLETTALIMDIGGGSTEFIIADQSTTYWQKSFRLGVSHLFEKIQPNDPMSDLDINRLRKELEHTLVPLQQALKQWPCDLLIGSSGSFDSIVDMIEHRWGSLNPEQLARPILMGHFNWIYKHLIGTTREERVKVPGLKPIRADFIVISMIFIQYMVKNLGLNNLHQSEYALKEGVIKELQQQNPLWNNT
ncbi:MAG: hypothetical protein ACPGED_01040 [Flavobacteriales bacterium]